MRWGAGEGAHGPVRALSLLQIVPPVLRSLDARVGSRDLLGMTPVEQRRARGRRRRTARRFRPDAIKTLLVAEAPPAALDRYFYFTDVREHDHLFRYVVRGALRKEPTRESKKALLEQLRDRGIFLIDLSPVPLAVQPLASFVPALVARCVKLAPERIILIKATVYDAAYTALRDAGLPVVDGRIPFPSSGRQRRFAEAFSRALKARPKTR